MDIQPHHPSNQPNRAGVYTLEDGGASAAIRVWQAVAGGVGLEA